MELGAIHQGGSQTLFRVWAPFQSRVLLSLQTPQQKEVPLQQDSWGYWQGLIPGVPPGSKYFYRLQKGELLPDPASRLQPHGVHQTSEVVDHAGFAWQDQDWPGLQVQDMILYELHVGTFAPQGTLQAIIPRLPELKELGVNTLSLMPVAQFPGSRNWGYDGVYPFAVQNSYGGPQGLKELVNACHRLGLAVILDVVYNHLGPEGNYLPRFGPYFTDKYHTPWGPALNFDSGYSDQVRNFFLQNALQWQKEFHLDGLRLDAVHTIFDQSPKPFLQELQETVQAQARETGKPFNLIAESDLNDARLLRSPEQGGCGLNAQWLDDFHHSLHALLTGERQGYYQDFGSLKQLQKSLQQGYALTWDYSRFRKRRHGSPDPDLPPGQLIAYDQSHDQVGNRMQGDRLCQLVSFEQTKLAAALTLLAPFPPMLFMGQEYAETAPFLYFISHGDQDLIKAVRRGRKQEFAAFGWTQEPPDPQSLQTFQASWLHWELRHQGRHAVLRAWHQELLRLRRSLPCLASRDLQSQRVQALEEQGLLLVFLNSPQEEAAIIFAFQAGVWPEPLAGEGWEKLLDSWEQKWFGPGCLLPDRAWAPGAFNLPGPGAALLRRCKTST
ncbi:MAG: malto-oligosyltrehalose trehalohydrolase [Desulfohalobiaceae bacterium]